MYLCCLIFLFVFVCSFDFEIGVVHVFLYIKRIEIKEDNNKMYEGMKDKYFFMNFFGDYIKRKYKDDGEPEAYGIVEHICSKIISNGCDTFKTFISLEEKKEEDLLALF